MLLAGIQVYWVVVRNVYLMMSAGNQSNKGKS